MRTRIPFQERKTPWRGVLDVVTGCYPRFLAGGPVGRLLPVFHFHQVTPDGLAPALHYLAENGYSTVTSEEIAAFARKGVWPGDRRVALTFDDGWLSLWTVAMPILRSHGFRAVAYISPHRVPAALAPRPVWGEPGFDPAPGDPYAFASWPELKAMKESGVIDIQAHSFSHSVVFCDEEITGFVGPDYRPHTHLRPLLNTEEPLRHVTAQDLGCPLYATRSRMSDARRYVEPRGARERCLERVRREGGGEFFRRPDWRDVLRAEAGTEPGRYETPEERRDAIREELTRARTTLNEQLGGSSVRHMCFPFAICGRVAESLLPETGYESAFADRLFGVRAVTARSNAYRLMRLKNQHIRRLPGRGRRAWGFPLPTEGSP